MNIEQVIGNFRNKYNFKDIWAVAFDDVSGVIMVYTSNAKVWVDLPASYEGYTVQMRVGKAPRPAPATR